MAALSRSDVAALSGVLLGSSAQALVLDRLLFTDAKEYGFVLESVRGIFSGTPAFPAWQQRLLGPFLVRALGRFTESPLTALRAYTCATVLVANALLYALYRKRAVQPSWALGAVVAFSCARCLSTYRLEYPWDGIDVFLFMLFGYSMAARWPVRRVVPLLVAGALNHETVLYLPLWYVLAATERSLPETRRENEVVTGILWGALLGAFIFTMRKVLYVGQPALAGQVFDPPAPVIANNVHVAHNLRQLLSANWTHGHALVSTTFLAVVAAAAVSIVRKRRSRAGWWTLAVLGTIVAFGYVNETRLYFPLLAFWSTYSIPEVSRWGATAAVAPVRAL